MNSQSRGMAVAIRNANDGLSVAQTAEAGINVITTHLQRMRELAVQAASGQYDSDNRSALDTEFQALKSEVNRVISATNFNGQELLTASSGYATGSGVIFQVGATTGADSQIAIKTVNLEQYASTLGSVSDVAGASTAMDSLDEVIKQVNTNRANLGAVQNRFEGVVSQLESAREATEASRSRIMDADYAAETANLSRAQILQQAGVAMLSQANAMPQNVLTLLQQ
jgi:flagellin